MKNFIRKRLASALAAMLLTAVGAGAQTWEAGEGANFANVVATFVDGTLTFSGTGRMKDHGYYNRPPWSSGRFAIDNVVIEDGVTSIGAFAFGEWEHHNLTSVTIPNSVTYIGEGAFIYCRLLASVAIPNNVDSIGQNVFYGCSGLTSITVPNSVAFIDGGAFSDCDNLTSITILNPIPPSCDYGEPFNSLDNPDVCLYVPASGFDAYASADYWKDFRCINSINDNTAVASNVRVIPPVSPGVEEAAVIERGRNAIASAALPAGLAVGPNPADALRATPLRFFRQGLRIESASLYIYDASGNVIKRLNIDDNVSEGVGRRIVSSWDLKDAKGRPVGAGTYLVKGVVKATDGKLENVSAVVGVR